MLRATADGGDQRIRERAHYEQQISERDTQILDLKDRLMKKEQEIYVLQNKSSTQEAQIQNLKKERDRLLDVSKNLRISMNKLEK